MHFEALVSLYRSFLVMAPWTFQLGPTNPSLCPLRAQLRSSRQERVGGIDGSFDRCQTSTLVDDETHTTLLFVHPT